MNAPTASKFTAPRALPRQRRVSPLVWLNLVCLDAPLVAVSWHWLFAREFGIASPRGVTAALFLTAWVIYLADRFVDSVTADRAAAAMSLRQEFCLRHRRVWIGAVVVIAIADLAVVVGTLDRLAVYVGCAIGACAVAYLLINQLRPSLWRVLPLKEVSIGVIFAGGVMVGLIRSLPRAAVLSWVLFASLCVMNCICIAVWERWLDIGQRRISIATAFPGFGVSILPLLLVNAGGGLAISPSAIGRCVFASAALLAFVHLCRRRIRPDTQTALADLVLLTPVLALAS